MLAIIAPSLDDKRIYPVGALRPGAVHRSRIVMRHASGKGANAARVAAALGASVRLCAFAGEEMRLLLEEQFACDPVRLDLTATQQPTRSCVTVVEDDGRATELVQEALPVEPAEAEAFLEAARRAIDGASVLLLAGSVPPGMPVDVYAQCILRAQERGTPVIIDAQKQPLLSALVAQPDIVRINREELAAAVERDLTADDVEAAARELQSLGARTVVVSDGPAPLTMVPHDDRALLLRPPAVETVNSVGSGDAMCGGIAAALLDGRDELEAVRTGIAAGAANAMRLLPGDVDAALVQRIRNMLP